ncbi:MAG: SusD/RagB family nutrient-binding outer membrane lipoprotein [Saprospiraceae bacterium]
MKFKISIIIVCLFAVTSCTDDFTEINTNPNAPVEVEPSLLLRNVLWESGEKLSWEGFVAGSLLAQQIALIDFNNFDRHDLTGVQFGGNPWPILYTLMRDNEIILEQSRANPAYAKYEGPALILKTYLAGITTDLFGDIPYFEAVSGKSGVVSPVYDSQEDIYNSTNGLLDNLEKGIAAIQATSGNNTLAFDGDILYGGNLNNWVKFANSLKIKYLMRMSDVGTSVNLKLQTIYDEGNYIKTPEQNATFDFSTAQPNNFRMATARAGDFQVFVMALTMEEVLKNLNDPRIEVFFRPTANTPTAYQGTLNGPNTAETPVNAGDVSFAGTIFRERTGDLDANFMTSFETNLLLAEAAERGLLFEPAQPLYEVGVTQAFEYWGATMPTDYLTAGDAAYGTNPLEQIATQKWIANIGNGYESWIDWRRTGFPALKTISASLNNDLIPVRMPYPNTEAALNTVNYNAAASTTNDNSVNAKVWWDVN